MKRVKIESPLTVKQWKRQWNWNIVNDDDKQSRKAYREKDCYYGHFLSKHDFMMCWHKSLDGTGMSTYFYGTIEKHGKGSLITGYFSKKKGSIVFLMMGIILSALVTVLNIAVAVSTGDWENVWAPALFCALFVAILWYPGTSQQEKILYVLQKMSFPTKKDGSQKHMVVKETSLIDHSGFDEEEDDDEDEDDDSPKIAKYAKEPLINKGKKEETSPSAEGQDSTSETSAEGQDSASETKEGASGSGEKDKE